VIGVALDQPRRNDHQIAGPHRLAAHHLILGDFAHQEADRG
jgi:hypothetical protein